MRDIAGALHALALTLWIGGLWTVGFIVAPVLFATLDDRLLAGTVAGKLFTWMAWIGIACGAYSLLFRLARLRGGALRVWAFWLVALMLVLVIAGQFYVQPILAEIKAQALPLPVMESAEAVLRDRFRTWHGVSSILYTIVSVLGVAVICLDQRGRA